MSWQMSEYNKLLISFERDVFYESRYIFKENMFHIYLGFFDWKTRWNEYIYWLFSSQGNGKKLNFSGKNENALK